MFTTIRGKLVIPFTASISHLSDAGAALYVEESIAVDEHGEHDDDQARRWYQAAYEKQMALQQAILRDPVMLKEFLRQRLIDGLEQIDPVSINDVIKPAAAITGDESYFLADLYQPEADTFERAQQVIDCTVVRPGECVVEVDDVTEMAASFSADNINDALTRPLNFD